MTTVQRGDWTDGRDRMNRSDTYMSFVIEYREPQLNAVRRPRSVTAGVTESRRPQKEDAARRPNRLTKQKWFVAYLLGCGGILGCAVLALVCLWFDDALAGTAIAVFCLLLAEVVCLISWAAATGRWVDSYSIFVTAVWIFNGGGIAIAQLMRPNSTRILVAFRDGPFAALGDGAFVVPAVLVAVSISLAHFLCLSYRIRLAASRQPHVNVFRERQAGKILSRIGMILVFIAAVPSVIVLRSSYSKVLSGGYMALFQDSYFAAEETWYYKLSSGLVPGLLYLAGTVGYRSRPFRLVCYGLAILYSAALLALGTRALFFCNLVAILFFHHVAIRRLSAKLFLTTLLVAASVSSAVALARATAEKGPIKAVDIVSAYGESAWALSAVYENLTTFFDELGSSIVTVSYTVELVPATKPFELGASYLEAISTIVPVNMRSHEMLAQKQGKWLITAVSPDTAANGGGLGFSLIAEGYENFGWCGPTVVLIIIGLGFTRLSVWSMASNNGWRVAVVAATLSIMVFAARGSSFTFVRRTAWLVLVPYLLTVAAIHLTDNVRTSMCAGTRPRGK